MTGSPAEREDAALAALLERADRFPPGRVEPYGPHPYQVLEWYAVGASSGARPVVVVHGGFFRPTIDRVHARPMAAALAARLHAPVVLAEYRRVSGHPEAAVADVAAVSDVLEAMGEEPVWVGHSAGGTLVLQRGLDQVRPAAAVVALAPVADLRGAVVDRLGDGAVVEWLGPRTAAKPSRYAHLDPARLVEELPERRASVTCVHGSADLTVPLGQSRSSGLPLLVLDGAHHYDLIDPDSAAWPRVVDVISDLVRRT